MDFSFNDTKLKTLRRTLRSNQAPAERILWSYLRNRQFHGVKFHRQYGVDNYIVDFNCPEKRLAIELDGSQHNQAEKLITDKYRTKHLAKHQIQVIRFWNNEITDNIEGVLERLNDSIK